MIVRWRLSIRHRAGSNWLNAAGRGWGKPLTKSFRMCWRRIIGSLGRIRRRWFIVGMQVILTSRDATKGEAAAQAIQREGKEVDFHQLDVTDEKSVAALLQFVKAEYGRLDVLVNNAGVYLDEGVSIFDVDMGTVRT